MRVLHLIDSSSVQATPVTLALLEASLGRLGHTDQRVLLLGGARLSAMARAAGVQDAATLGVPFAKAVLGAAAVYRRVKRMGRFDAVHCWSAGALSLAACLWRDTPRVLSLTATPAKRGVRWLRVLTAERGAATTLLPISATIRQALLSGGVKPSAVHVLRPGIDLARAGQADRQSLRAQWGAQDPADKVIALLTDNPRYPDALMVGLAFTAANNCDTLSGFRLRLLLHPAQAGRRVVEDQMRYQGQASSVIQEPRLDEPWAVLAGCDLALALDPNGGGLSALWAMAANTPIIAEATYGVCELLEDRHSALLTQPGSTKSLAQRVMQMLSDTQLAWRLRDTARHEAYSFFSRQRYCQSLQSVYQQINEGREVDVPPLEPTGGLRFSGRA